MQNTPNMLHDQKNISLLFHLSCSLTPGIGPLKFRKLLNCFGSPHGVFSAKTETVATVLGQKETCMLNRIITNNNLKELLDKWQKESIYVIPQDSEYFPKNLKNLIDAPICIFAKLKNGLQDFSNAQETVSLAVVGSRKHTVYGKIATENIVSALAVSRITIVSGMALGIDAIAHWASLKNKGKTIAVLGCGVDVVYPTENKPLYDFIYNTGNCIISEFAPGSRPTKGSFIARNRIISGISNGTLIIEGDEKSGSLTTAGFAAEQNKDLFALPGPITSPLSQAPLKLLKNGAYLVSQAEDILNYYNLGNNRTKKQIDMDLNNDERVVYSLLEKNELFTDEIARESSLSLQAVAKIITSFEINGIIQKDELGKYHLLSIIG